MAKRIELDIGSEFGDWTILEDSRNDKRGPTQYKCQCSCGFTRNLIASLLKSGRTKNCRKCHFKKHAENQRALLCKDETGLIYNRWEVLEKVGIVSYVLGKNFPIYKVKHFCGEIRTVRDFFKFKSKSIRCWICKPKKK